MAEYIERSVGVSILRAKANMAVLSDAAPYFEKVAQMLEKLPAADVAPVVHGRWIWHETDFEYECSACNDRFDYNHTFGIFDHGFEQASYCPNCGAKMDRSERREDACTTP